jgi:PadR family transcriptional regulator, regulatory protein PadR
MVAMNQEKTKKDIAKLTALDEDILTCLLGRELYGLAILDQLNLDRPNELSFGSLYPALNRLDKKGYVVGRWGDDTEPLSGARRKYYKVTGLGHTVLMEVRGYRASLAKQGERNLPVFES